MAELNGYVLTKEEEKACENLVKKMRAKRDFIFEFSASVKIKAKNSKEAEGIFWKWAGDVGDYTLSEWGNVGCGRLYIDNYILDEE